MQLHIFFLVIFVLKFLQMKLKTAKMTKRMILLLVAVFAWLFVGSLIIFHQEHVLGKHTNAISQHFIVPKSKEKAGLSVKQLPSSQKISLFSGQADLEQLNGQAFIPGACEKLNVSPAGLFNDHPPRMIYGLRAPPAV